MLAKKELQQNNQHLHHHHHDRELLEAVKQQHPDHQPMEGMGDVCLAKEAVDGVSNETGDANDEDNYEDVYGELVVLGFNGIKPQHWLIHSSSAARRDLCTKYRLRRRYQPNGVIATQKMKQQPSKSATTAPFQNTSGGLMTGVGFGARTTHSVSYKMSKSEVLVEEYLHDDFTDLFQVGRSTERPIDFTVRDYWPTLPASQALNNAAVLNKTSSVDSAELDVVATSNSNQQSRHHQQPVSGSGSNNKNNAVVSKMSVGSPVLPPLPAAATESTISRFACRIIVNRTQPFQPRIFAAGFDNDNNIFLGEKAIKWKADDGKGTLDALTTNGVLIMKPQGGELWQDTVQAGTVWREISVCGAVSAVRPARSSKDRGQAKINETNVLTDGTMIDLCGVTLLYRSPEGLVKSPKLEDLEHCLGALNAGRPQCPVGLNTLVIPKQKPPHGAAARTDRDPYAYLPCGHVQGRHSWGKQPNHLRQCPMCFRQGKAIRLCMGMEPAFYVGVAVSVPDHAFIPCGHIASKATCQYWSQVMVPIETTSFRPSTPVCPFCGTALDKKQSFVRLIYQTENEMT